MKHLAALLLVLALGGAARAENYPSKPVTILVPYAPGGATDVVARVVADELRQSLGQNFIVQNKPGAFGIIAIQELAKARPDGYTLMIGNVSTNAITPILFAAKMQLDYKTAIMPVTELGDLPGFLVANASFPPKSVAEYIDYVKQHRGQVRFASAGLGSYPHLDMVMLANRAGIDPAKDLVHIPIKGGAADVVNSMATGDAQIAFLNVAISGGMIKSGRLFPLAVTTAERLPEWPGVPTMTEAGYAGVGTNQWQGLFVRSDTPRPIVDTLYKATVQALNSDAAKKVFVPANIRVVVNGSPEAAATWLQEEIGEWRKVVAASNLQLD